MLVTPMISTTRHAMMMKYGYFRANLGMAALLRRGHC
jgi:hypothetical protein